MYDEIIEDAERSFPRKAVLTIEEIAEFLNCEPGIIYNWTRRPDPSRRPPRLMVGKDIRFPKREFFRWLMKDQGLGD